MRGAGSASQHGRLEVRPSHRRSRHPVRRLAGRSSIQIAALGAVLLGAVGVVGNQSLGHADRTIAIADAYTDTTYPTARHGTEKRVTISSTAATRRIGYLKFDVGRVPKDAAPRLTLDITGNAGTLEIHTVDARWDERTVDAANAPRKAGLLAAVDVSAGRHWLAVDIPRLIGKNGIFSFAIIRATSSGSTQISSTESGSQTAPRLELYPPQAEFHTKLKPKPRHSPTATSSSSPTASATPSPSSTAGDPTSAAMDPGSAGSVPVGSSAYPVPSGAIFVAPSGDDSAPGSESRPLRTLSRAISVASAGATIVLREGTYHEFVIVPSSKTLTIQSYPHEAVWLDGSSRVSSWTSSGGMWRREGWTAQFDSSPSYTSGAAQSSDVDFRFIDPNYPMAAHPDGVWFDGAPLRQVGSQSEVRAGTFYVDYSADRLYVGSDPAGHEVRAADLGEAVTIRSAGSVLRGLGVRRYATSLPKMATVKVEAPSVRVENVVITDNATQGLSALGHAHVTFAHVTASRNGIIGIHANYADDLRLESVLVEDNNTEHFKFVPVAGGMKITRSRGVAVVDSVARNNRGTGIWMDESVYDMTLTGDDVIGNAHHGISLEISAKAIVANNVVNHNGDDGMKINDTANVQIWNNTLTGNGRSLNLTQDLRRASDLSTAGHDPRQQLPDPTMTWLLGNVSVGNNVIADPKPSAGCMLCIEDYSHERSAAQMNITANGDVYVRADASTPRLLAVWSRGAGDPAVFASLDAFRSSTGQEASGREFAGASAADSDGNLAISIAQEAAAAARSLPPAVAEALGVSTSTRQIGAWR
jgi:parallel beta-helix repeat protein